MVLLACLMLEKVKRQEMFTTWPLHLTLVPWFEISVSDLSRFLKEVESAATSMTKLTLVVGKIAYFGSAKAKVTLIKPDDALLGLHHKLLDIIYGCNAKLLADNHIAQSFKPHVTNRGPKGPARKETVCRQMHLVARCEQGKRQVVGVVNFSKV